MTDHNPLPMPNNGLCENVVFQPCGHRSLLIRDTIRELGASDQLAAIDIGNQFSAVALDSNDCTKCNPKPAVPEAPLEEMNLQVS